MSRILEQMWVDRSLLSLVELRSAPGWGGIQASKGFADCARELGFDEARVAVQLKAARVQGLVEQTNPRTLQAAFIITEKGSREVAAWRETLAASPRWKGQAADG